MLRVVWEKVLFGASARSLKTSEALGLPFVQDQDCVCVVCGDRGPLEKVV